MDITGLLFKSKIRKKILTRFFADEKRKFYINEMARLVNTSQGTCRRELNNLVNAGLLVRSRHGNSLYYGINKTFPLYKEFRAIIQKTIGIEAILARKLNRLKGIVFAFIFGSYVKNNMKPDSDIDIVIIGTIDQDRIIKVFSDIERTVTREINFHVYSSEEFKNRLASSSFTRNILKNYIIVAGDDGDFRALLEKAGI